MKGRESVIWQRTLSLDTKVEYGTYVNEYIVLSKVCGDFKCTSVSGEDMRHWEIFKILKDQYLYDKSISRKGVEPYYAEKIAILKEIGRWKKVALEVMPDERELVDRENLYHMWEFEHINSFQLDTAPIFNPPKRFREKYEGLHYEVVRQKGVIYIYFQSDDQVPWRKKQAIKNHAVGPHRTGVEIITESMLNVGYGVIIVLPYNLQLSFGLV